MKKQLIDQGAHFFIAMAAMAVIFISFSSLPFWLAGGILGLILGLVREVTQHDGFVVSSGSLLDLVFWTWGGSVGALLISSI
jgi:hypothetical protein